MFIIELTYKVELSKVDAFLSEHVAFLDRAYANGALLFSGRKNPRDGGVMVSNLKDRSSVEALISEDPFFREEIATYRIVEFTPTKYDQRLCQIFS